MAEPDLIREKATFKLDSEAGRSAAQILKGLNAHGHEALIAGGAVRDHLRGTKPKDYDVATEARPQEVCKIFKKTQKVGIAFGVVLVTDFGPPVEVATFRSDGTYSDGRRPDDVTFCDAKEDAKRRDFSVNGLFYSLQDEEILDYVGGLKDLERKQLRAIGSPEQRFAEDHLRLLRAIRFSLRLGFDIEAETFEAMQKLAEKIKLVAMDRIHGELQMIYGLKQNDEALGLLLDSGLYAHLFPDALERPEIQRLKEYAEMGDFASSMSLILAGKDDERLDEIMDAMRFSNQEKKCLRQYQRKLQKFRDYPSLRISEKKRVLRGVSTEPLLYFLSRSGIEAETLKSIESDAAKWDASELSPDLLITGKDLIEAGFKPGPEMGRCLKFIEDLILEGEVKDREELWSLLKEHPDFQASFK